MCCFASFHISSKHARKRQKRETILYIQQNKCYKKDLTWGVQVDQIIAIHFGWFCFEEADNCEAFILTNSMSNDPVHLKQHNQFDVRMG